jgi:hypothetical protein
MNHPDTRFDRLVDGELSAEEYRALVAALDDEPGGWRKCATAFLESQALSADLTHVRRGLDLTDPAAVQDSPPPTSRRQPRKFDLIAILAVALSFVLAFTLGTLAPRFFRAHPQDPAVAGNKTSAPPMARQVQPQLAGNVRLVMDGPGGGSTETGDVPVYDVGTDLEGFFGQGRPALPAELVELLKQRGHDVVRQEQYVPAQLDDGRQVIVPVERYLITPVSQRAY